MIKRQPLFLAMDLNAVSEILDALSAKLIREHTQIATTRQNANTLYLIASGRASLEGKNESYELEPGDIFGQESLEVGAECQSTITARSEMRLLVLAGDDLRRLARKYPVLHQRLTNQQAW
jgi:CRP-like cAMP-binding protein